MRNGIIALGAAAAILLSACAGDNPPYTAQNLDYIAQCPAGKRVILNGEPSGIDTTGFILGNGTTSVYVQRDPTSRMKSDADYPRILEELAQHAGTEITVHATCSGKGTLYVDFLYNGSQRVY